MKKVLIIIFLAASMPLKGMYQTRQQQSDASAQALLTHTMLMNPVRPVAYDTVRSPSSHKRVPFQHGQSAAAAVAVENASAASSAPQETVSVRGVYNAVVPTPPHKSPESPAACTPHTYHDTPPLVSAAAVATYGPPIGSVVMESSVIGAIANTQHAQSKKRVNRLSIGIADSSKPMVVVNYDNHGSEQPAPQPQPVLQAGNAPVNMGPEVLMPTFSTLPAVRIPYDEMGLPVGAPEMETPPASQRESQFNFEQGESSSYSGKNSAESNIILPVVAAVVHPTVTMQPTAFVEHGPASDFMGAPIVNDDIVGLVVPAQNFQQTTQSTVLTGGAGVLPLSRQQSTVQPAAGQQQRQNFVTPQQHHNECCVIA